MTSGGDQASLNAAATRLAQAVISEQLHLVEGVRSLVSVLAQLEVIDDEEFASLVTLVSETEGFPVGATRKYLHPNVLRHREETMGKYVAELRDEIVEACWAVIERFSNAGS